MKFMSVLLTGTLLSLAGAAWAQGPGKITPGEWETTSDVTDFQMQGAPAGMPKNMLQRMKPPQRVLRYCITPEQAANPKANMLAAQKESKCDVHKFEMSGGRMDMAMTCTNPKQGGGKADISMTGLYTPTSYTTDGTMHMSGPNGMVMVMKTHTTGRHVGACSK